MSRQNTINNQVNTAPQHVTGLSLGDILRGFWARKIPIILFIGLTLVATYVYLSRVEPVYKSDAKVLIEGNDPDTNKFSTNIQATPADLLQVSSQAQIIQSHDLASQVIKNLNLNTRPEFTTQSGFFGPKKKAGAGQDIVRENYFDKLIVYPIAQTRVIAVEFSSTSPELAAKMANELSRIYVESTRQAPLEVSKQTNTYLYREINKLRSDITAREKTLEKFRARNGMIEGNQGTLYAQELAELNRQIAEVSSVRAEASAKAASARRLLGGNQSIDISADVLNSALIQRLREEQIRLRRQITEKSTTYLPAHPEMVQLNQQLQNLDRLVAFEVTKIAASLSNQAKIAAARENTLRAKLNRLKTKAVGQGQNAAKLKAMERDIEAKRNLLNTYLTKQTETLSRQDISNIPYGARIISKAVVASTPFFPKKGSIMFLAFVSATILAFVASFLRDASSNSFAPAPALAHPPQNASTEDFINKADPYSAPAHTVPYSAPAPSIVGSADQSGHSSQFHLALSDKTDLTTLYAGGNELESGLIDIANQAYQAISSSGSKIILVTSPETYPQKSFISAGLARLYAQKGLKTVVIDADMLAPSIAPLMSVQSAPGLSDIMIGAAPFSETIIKDRNTGASVLPAGDRGAQAYAQLGTDSANLVLRSLSMVYDIIILHAPSMRDHAATQHLASQSAFVCLAAKKSQGRKNELGTFTSILLSSGAGHVAQVNCAAKTGGMMSGLFKRNAA